MEMSGFPTKGWGSTKVATHLDIALEGKSLSFQSMEVDIFILTRQIMQIVLKIDGCKMKDFHTSKESPRSPSNESGVCVLCVCLFLPRIIKILAEKYRKLVASFSVADAMRWLL